MEKHYCERDLLEMDRAGNHYGNHVMAMTAEQLHSKSDIAAELGWRDMKIAELQHKLDALYAEIEKFAVQCAAAKIAVQYAKVAGFECTLNTPDVDAYLNEVRAEGLDMAAAEIDKWVGCDLLAREIRQKSAQLRAGAPKGDSE